MLHKKKRAATRPVSPVKDTAGPTATAALSADPVLEADEESPPLVELGLVSGLALLVRQVLTPLMTPLSCAALNWSQMVLFVEVV